MDEKLLLVDLDRCIRCHACEVACKQQNDLPPGPQWTSVVTIDPRWVAGELCMDFVFATCFHCDDPVCASACPDNAIAKRDDGIVLIDEERCKGCSLCVYACPFGAVYINAKKKVAWKCTLCVDRLDHGLEPSCVQHCAGGALQYVTEEELLEIAAGRHKARIGKVCYVSTKWKLSI